MPAPPPVLLASTSPYRRALLERILDGFETAAPGVDEALGASEAPVAAALRLAREKALAVAGTRSDAIVIGGDQVPVLDGRALQKPGNHDRAVRQLRDCSGRTVVFHSAVAVAGPGERLLDTHVDETTVSFRELDEAEILRYLDKDQPYDCAGSFKVESLGITLFSSMETSDPTAIQGLPLIWLSDCLRRRGIPLP